MLRKYSYSFVIVNKRANVVCEVSFWYKASLLFFGVLITLALTINKTHLRAML